MEALISSIGHTRMGSVSFRFNVRCYDKDDPWYRPDIKWDYVKGKDCIWNYISVYDNLVENVKEEDIIFREVKTPLFNRIHQFYRDFYHNEDSCYRTDHIKQN